MAVVIKPELPGGRRLDFWISAGLLTNSGVGADLAAADGRVLDSKT
jgi:hypothetical protein